MSNVGRIGQEGMTREQEGVLHRALEYDFQQDVIFHAPLLDVVWELGITRRSWVVWGLPWNARTASLGV